MIHARSQTHNSSPSRNASAISNRVGSAERLRPRRGVLSKLGLQALADLLGARQVQAQQIAAIIRHTVILTHVEMTDSAGCWPAERDLAAVWLRLPPGRAGGAVEQLTVGCAERGVQAADLVVVLFLECCELGAESRTTLLGAGPSVATGHAWRRCGLLLGAQMLDPGLSVGEL